MQQGYIYNIILLTLCIEVVPGGGGPVHPINSLHACYGLLHMCCVVRIALCMSVPESALTSCLQHSSRLPSTWSPFSLPSGYPEGGWQSERALGAVAGRPPAGAQEEGEQVFVQAAYPCEGVGVCKCARRYVCCEEQG